MNRAFSFVVTALALSSSLLSSACFDLDSFVMNPTHCSVGYTDDQCTLKKMCTPCDEAYPFADFGLPADTATRHPIELADGERNDAWFFPAGADGPLSGTDVTIVFSHGNFGSLEHYLNRVGLLWATGANVFAVDYRGFGQSSSTAEATEAEFMDDARRAWAFVPDVLAAHGLDPAQPLAIYGYSAGALSAVEMAVAELSDPEVAGPCTLILEAPWPSAQRFTDDSSFIGVPGSFVTTGAWDNITKLQHYSRPYLQLHGVVDLTVRVELGREVFDVVESPDKQLVEVAGAAHGNYLFVDEDTVERDVPAVLGEAEYRDLLVRQIGNDCR